MAVESVDPAKCGVYQMHGPHHTHKWRGWWFKKTYCPGTPFPGSREINFPEDWVPPSAALVPAKSEPVPFPDDFESEEATLVPLTIFDHRHDFKLAEGIGVGTDHFLRKPEGDLLWICDWNDCNHVYVTGRDYWYTQGCPYDVYSD